MSASKANPTVRRWELAAALRALRLDAGLSVEDVASELMCSAAKVSRLETAGRGIQPRDVRDLCRLYKVTDAERDRLMALATEAKQSTWWHGLPRLSTQTTAYIDLEGAANTLRALEAGRLHGLLQTEAYTRNFLARLKPPNTAYDPDFIDQTVAARRRRQEIAKKSGARFIFILDESAISRPIGSLDESIEQIDQLIQVNLLDNHSIHVVPYSRGLYPGLDGTFCYLTFPQETMPDVVLVEGTLGMFVLDKAIDAARYRSTFEYVLSEFALSVDESQAWLSRLRENRVKSSS
jgi:transcriptional regulator with XRE-family HTH domain